MFGLNWIYILAFEKAVSHLACAHAVLPLTLTNAHVVYGARCTRSLVFQVWQSDRTFHSSTSILSSLLLSTREGQECQSSSEQPEKTTSMLFFSLSPGPSVGTAVLWSEAPAILLTLGKKPPKFKSWKESVICHLLKQLMRLVPGWTNKNRAVQLYLMFQQVSPCLQKNTRCLCESSQRPLVSKCTILSQAHTPKSPWRPFK